MNFRLQPDLASSAKPPMSIRHPPSIAPPDHQWLTFWLSPSVSSSGSASFSTLQLSLVRLLLAWLFDQCACLRLRLNLCSLTGCLPPAFTGCLLPFIRQPPCDSLLSHQLNETLAPLNLWMQVQKSGKSVDITSYGAKGRICVFCKGFSVLIWTVSGLSWRVSAHNYAPK